MSQLRIHVGNGHGSPESPPGCNLLQPILEAGSGWADGKIMIEGPVKATTPRVQS